MKFRTVPCLLLAGVLLAGGAHADEAAHITASHGWIRILPGNLPAGAYVTLTNHGDKPAVLQGASSPAYGEVMLHKSSTEGGVSRMSMVKALNVPAHGTVRLAPGGYHLMLMKAGHPIEPGNFVRMTLRFRDGSHLVSNFIARPANAVDAGD